MATLRQKTIRVPVNFGNVSSFLNNTLTLIGTPTIYIPENGDSAVTFKSVMLSFSFEDTATGGGGVNGTEIHQFQTEINLQDAASPSNITVDATTPILNTGENITSTFFVDYTSYFTTDTGWDSDQTSQTCSVKILLYTDSGLTTDWQKVYGWFDITYEYDADAGTNRIQTVCIPYESRNTYQSTTPQEIGILPQLTGEGGILSGYTTPVVRHRWVEVKGNTYLATANYYLRYSFDGGTINDLPAMTGSLNSSIYETYLIDASALDTATSHSFELGASNGSRWPSIVVNEWLTFEYTTTDTTRVLNYVEIPFEMETHPLNNEAQNSSFSRELLIPEKNITPLNGAIEVTFNCNVPPFYPNIRVGTQPTYREYLLNSSVVAGSFTFQHRFDSGSASGEGLSLSSGLNNISAFIYNDSNQALTNIQGCVRCVYLSDVSSTGIDNHSQVVRNFIKQTDMKAYNYASTRTIQETSSFSIPNDEYYLQSVGLQYQSLAQYNTAGINFKARILPEEGIGEGYRVLYSDTILSDSELAYVPMYIRARDEFRRYPGDPDTNRLNIESNRGFVIVSSQTNYSPSLNWAVTYHGITHTISGSIAGSTNLTSSLQLFQVVDGEYNLYKTGSVEGDADFQFTVYDDTTNYIVSSYISPTLKGVSKSATPGDGFDIDYATGGEFFF